MEIPILSSYSLNPKYKKTVTTLFFMLILFTGLTIYKDYGISWDEETSRKNGLYSYNYVFKGDNALLTYKDRDHGIAFELPLIIIEKALGLKDTQDIFHMRHLFTFLIFFISLIFYYLLGKDYLGDWKIGLLGSLFLLLSPRIFAHSFYNSKDLPFLSFYLISMYTLIRLLDTKSLHHAFLHGLVCAILIDIRIIGIIVPVLTFFFVFIDFIKSRVIGNNNKIIIIFCIYLISLNIFIFLFWPYLWSNPVTNFIQAFFNMSYFRWNSAMLFMGKYINPPQLPWHYIPVWIIITTPLLYIFNFFIGLLPCLKSVVSGTSIFDLNKKQRNDFILLSYFFLPLIAVIVLNSALYDGWRHLFFIYPPLLMISLRGLVFVFKYFKQVFKKKYQIVSCAYILLIVSQLFSVAFFMIEYHPHQNMFFSFLAGKNMPSIKKAFEFDYWGLSYKQALEYIINNDTEKSIKIFAPNPMASINAKILPPSDRNRLKLVNEIKDAKYFMSNYRWHLEEYISENEFDLVVYNLYKHGWMHLKFNHNDEIFSVKIDGAKIVVVYKLPHYKQK